MVFTYKDYLKKQKEQELSFSLHLEKDIDETLAKSGSFTRLFNTEHKKVLEYVLLKYKNAGWRVSLNKEDQYDSRGVVESVFYRLSIDQSI